MRKTIFLAVGLLCIQLVYGQEVPDPEFSQSTYYLSNGRLALFDKADASMERKSKGKGEIEFFYIVEGEKSFLRFTQSSLPTLIIKMEDNSDPTEVYILRVGEKEKSGRKFSSSTMSSMGSMKPAIANRVKLAPKKLRDKVFQATIDQALLPGEYAIILDTPEALAKANTSGIKISCFGID